MWLRWPIIFQQSPVNRCAMTRRPPQRRCFPRFPGQQVHADEQMVEGSASFRLAHQRLAVHVLGDLDGVSGDGERSPPLPTVPTRFLTAGRAHGQRSTATLAGNDAKLESESRHSPSGYPAPGGLRRVNSVTRAQAASTSFSTIRRHFGSSSPKPASFRNWTSRLSSGSPQVTMPMRASAA